MRKNESFTPSSLSPELIAQEENRIKGLLDGLPGGGTDQIIYLGYLLSGIKIRSIPNMVELYEALKNDSLSSLIIKLIYERLKRCLHDHPEAHDSPANILLLGCEKFLTKDTVFSLGKFDLSAFSTWQWDALKEALLIAKTTTLKDVSLSTWKPHPSEDSWVFSEPRALRKFHNMTGFLKLNAIEFRNIFLENDRVKLCWNQLLQDLEKRGVSIQMPRNVSTAVNNTTLFSVRSQDHPSTSSKGILSPSAGM
jgi:hypothetical protein